MILLRQPFIRRLVQVVIIVYRVDIVEGEFVVGVDLGLGCGVGVRGVGQEMYVLRKGGQGGFSL